MPFSSIYIFLEAKAGVWVVLGASFWLRVSCKALNTSFMGPGRVPKEMFELFWGTLFVFGGTEVALGQHWEGALGLHWVCTGAALGLHWVCTGAAERVRWVCTGSALGLQWVCTEVPLGLHGGCKHTHTPSNDSCREGASHGGQRNDA